MASCVNTLALADGSLVFSPVQPQPNSYTECSYVLQSGSEISAFPPLSASQGLEISSSIGICWAAAYAFRMIGQFLNHDTKESE